MKTIELSDALSRRIENLAVEAGRTPKEILPYVIRDGLEYTENFIRKVKVGMADSEAGRVIEHETAMTEIRKLLQHADTQKAA